MKKLYIIFDQLPPITSGGLLQTYINLVDYLKNEYDIKIISVFNTEERNKKIFDGIDVICLSDYIIDNRFFQIAKYVKNGEYDKIGKAIASAFYFFLFIPQAKRKMSQMVHKDDALISVSPASSFFIHPKIQFIQDIHINFEYFWGNNKKGALQAKLMTTPTLTVFRNKTDAEKGARFFPSTYMYNFTEDIKYDLNSYNLDQRKNKIIYVGRLSEQKDPLRLLKCAKLMKDQQVSFHLDIYGKGDMEDEMKKKIKEYQIDDVVTMKGFMKDKKTYRNYSMLWMNSKYEGFGLVILEAKANATPTISTNWHGGIHEVIDNRNDGFIAENDNEFIEYTKELLNDDAKLIAFSKNAYHNYHQVFSNQATKKRAIHLIESYKTYTNSVNN